MYLFGGFHDAREDHAPVWRGGGRQVPVAVPGIGTVGHRAGRGACRRSPACRFHHNRLSCYAGPSATLTMNVVGIWLLRFRVALCVI